MPWLIAIVCIILAVAFWRIVLPVALVVAAVVVLFYLASGSAQDSAQRAQRTAKESRNARIVRAQATASDSGRSWEVHFERDPAGGDSTPRWASVQSDDGLCQLQVEERITGARLTSVLCSNMPVALNSSVEVKFDDRANSDGMELRLYSGGAGAYIPGDQPAYGRDISYDVFLARLASAKKVALRLTLEPEDQYWFAFSLQNAKPALMMLGALNKHAKR